MKRAVFAVFSVLLVVFAVPVQAQLLGGLLGDDGLVDVDAGESGLSVSVGSGESPVKADVSVGGGAGISADANIGGDDGVSAGASVDDSGVSASVSAGGGSGVSAEAGAGGSGVGASASVGGESGLSAGVGAGPDGIGVEAGADGAGTSNDADADGSNDSSGAGGIQGTRSSGRSVLFPDKGDMADGEKTGQQEGDDAPPSRLYMLARLIEAREWRHLPRVLADGRPKMRQMDIRRWVGRREVRDLPGVLVEKGALIARMQQAMAAHPDLFSDRDVEVGRVIAIDIRADGSIFLLVS